MKKASPARAVLFDFDGTLAESKQEGVR